MNKIYKLVWSKVRNAWVVASEIAKGHGKNASAARERKLLKTAVITAIMGGCLMTGGLASAALTAEQQAVYDAVMAKLEERGGNHYVSVNPLKKEQTADSNYENNGAKGDGGIAIGEDATSQGRGIAMGYKSKAVPKTGATANLNAFEGIAIGQEADMEVPGGIAIGLRSKVEGTLNTKDGEVNVNELGTIALGTDSYAKGNGAAAFGWKAKGNGEGAMAFGTETKAKESGTAFGGHADAAAGGVAVGWQAHAHDLWAMSIGTSSDAKGKYSTALGGSTTAEAVGSTAVGFKAVSKGVLSTAVGAQSVAEESGSVALGADSVANTKAGEIGYIATGESATFEDALKTLNKKEDYDKWTATVNASKTEYDNLTQAFNDASKDKKDEAKAALDEWKKGHKDFVNALEAKSKLEATWRATKAAVSVGADGIDKAGNKIIESRQITNVAAGTQDTDAVNVAQLKALNTKVDQGAIHYYSVTSDKKAAGSNFDNDGAKAADSMVIGIGSSSEATNSTVLGNNNTLKRYNADQNGSSSRNNIVVGQNMDVEGAHNAVFGTDYQNNRENRKTMVAGKYNTVIGVGNLAGYTAEKDPQDRFKWIYSKVQNGSDSGNVVVGMNNTATRSSIVIGADSEASSHGTSVGSNNKVIGNGDKGLALGNSLTVDGEQAVAIGSDSQAKADYAVAIGQEALAEKESSIAFGNSAKAQNNNSVAFGSFATATARSGVAIGSSSLANREKGAIGYLADAKTTSEAWKATRGAISIGNEEKGITRQLTGLAAGSEDTDAVNVAQLKAVNTKVEGNKIHYLSIGPDNEKNLAQDGNYNNDGADSHWGIAIGVNASSKGGGSIAIGKGSQAHGTEEHRAQGVSIGSASRAIGAFATAVGHDTKAFGEYSVAYGLGDAYGRGSIAIGSGAVAALKEGITKEEYNKLSDEEKAWYGKTDYDDQKIFYQFRHKGKDGKVEDIKNYGMAIGSGATSFDNAGLAVGLNAKTNKNFGVALGAYAENKVEQGVALGTSSVADRAKDVKGYLPTTGKAIENFEEAMKATGKEAAFKELKGKYLAAQEKLAKAKEAYKADQSPTNMMNLDKAQKELEGLTEEYAVMTAPWTSRRGAVSVGNDKTGFTRQITGVAAGSEDTDAVNVAQLKALDNKVTDKLKDAGGVHYFSVNSDDSANPDGTNWKNDGATGGNAVAIGKKAKAGKTNDIAIGTEAAATGGFGFAAGHQAKSSGNADIAIGANAEATGGWGVAIGQDTKAQASTAVAMAFAAEAKGANSLAIGVQSEARTNDSSAYGRGAKALGQVALAVGTLTKAEGNHSSVFGYKATTDSTAWNGTAIGRGAYIGKQAPDGTTPDIGVSDNYYMPVDDDTAVEAGKETKNSTAVGFGAKSFGYQNTAVGAGAEAFDTNTVAVGVMSKAIGHYANALGKQARAEGKNSVAIGHFARAIGESSTVLGDYAITSTLDGKKGVSKSVAVGSHARAASDNSIALGNNSLANIADNVKTEAYLSKETFKKENGVVSVGNKEYTVGNEKIEQNYRRITNVAGGADDHDAVNVAQLKVVNEKADKNATDITNLTKTVNANGKATKVTVDGEENKTNGNLKITKETKDGQTTYNLSLNDELTLGKDGKDGKIGINGKDGKSAEITVGKGEPGVDGTNGKDGITRIIYKDEKGNHHEVATLDDGLKFKGDNDTVVTRKLNTQLNITGGITDKAELSNNNIGVVGTQDGGMAVKLSKKLKGLTSAEFKDGDNVTNITGGNVTITRKEGNVDLWELNKTVNNITAGTTDVSSWKLQANGANDRTIKKNSIVNFTNGTATKVTVKGNDVTVDLNDATKKQINDNTTDINNMKNDITNIQNTVNNIDTKIEQKIEGSKIKVEGDDKTGIKVKEDKVNGKVKGYKVSLDEKVKVGNVAIDGKDGKGEITGLTNTTVDATDFATKGRAATEEQLKAAMGKVQAQSRTTVKGSNNITVTPKTPNAAEYTVGLAKDISVDSVTAKEYKVGDKTYINDKGINANKNKITNVADGVVSKDSKDAVNGSQLFATNRQVLNNMNQINNLREESREGDALGAAMAALKPLDFDPYQRSQVMAGVGYYRGKEAVALGLAHYKNEDLMIHGGLAYAGNSELMANVGVSYRFGSSENREALKARNLRMPQYDKGPISSVYILQDEVDRLTKENKEANDRIAALEAKLEKVLEKVK